MSILLFLNELSCGTEQSIQNIEEAMERFVALLRQLRRQRSDAALVSSVRREHIELAKGYYVSQWIGAHPRHRDLWRVIQGLQNRAPFSDVLPPGAVEGTDYSWRGLEARGLGAAHQMDGLLVSLLVDPVWDTQWVSGRCEELADTGEIDTYAVEVRHAGNLDHVRAHEDWIKSAGLTAFRSGSEIWEARNTLYPNLEFLPAVRSQLRDLRQDWVLSVARRLRTLDDAVAGWDPIRDREPSWGTKVTAEAEQRKRLCEFRDVDGSMQSFHLHARFTPDEGRVHLRLIPQSRKARIAHIGLKLGI